MWAIIGILAASAIIACIEVPSLLNKKMIKELFAFAALLLLGTGLSIAQSARVSIPNPLDWIAAVYRPMSDAILSLLR